jgi:hypothetical protein
MLFAISLMVEDISSAAETIIWILAVVSSVLSATLGDLHKINYLPLL